MIIAADFETCRGMEPEIKPGDIVQIETGAPIAESDIVLALIDGKPRFCRIKPISCGAWIVFSNNAYLPEFLPTEELEKISIKGKVTGTTQHY